jgi:transcriptional regulator with XRE-family HTH domain
MNDIIYESSNDIFKEQLKWIMHQENLSLRDVAKRTGFCIPTIRRYLLGERTPRTCDAIDIFESLGYKFNIYKAADDAKKSDKPLWNNGSGYLDKTACKAIKKVDAERENYKKLMEVITFICEMAGFTVVKCPEIKDVKTGKIWK